MESPSTEELLRVGSKVSDYPDKVGYWIGLSVACWEGVELDSCESVHEDSRIFCESALEKIEKDPLQCPSKIKKDMHGRGDRRGPVPPGGPAAPSGGPAAN